MRLPAVRLVFDRKKVATKQRAGLLQLEVSWQRRRRFFSTGVKLRKDQWHPVRWVVSKSDRDEVNAWLRSEIERLEKWLRENFTETPFSWERLDAYFDGADETDDFIGFVAGTIDGRNDIAESTRRVHRKLVTALDGFGGIRRFSDLTPSAVMDFDNWLHGRRVRKVRPDGTAVETPMKQQSIYDYHKMMKIYIHIAMRRGLVKRDPYDGQRFKHGESAPERYLTPDELGRLESAGMSTGGVARSRDLFLFQCYTGLSYSDLKGFDFSKAERVGGDYVYSGRRVKTGEQFYFVLLPKAMAILEKYGYSLPVTSLEVMNRNLKQASEDAGIGKPISSHWARRTAAMLFVNSGVRMEVAARILGHSTTLTTQRFYASITPGTVAEEMKKAVAKS